MFQKTVRLFIRELGKIDEKHKRVYKSAKKYRKLTAHNFSEYCHSTKKEMLDQEDTWFLGLYNNTEFPIDCSSMLSSYKETIWNHVYTVYISSMKELHDEIPKYLLSNGEEDIEEANRENFEFALHVYQKLANGESDVGSSQANMLNGLQIPTNIHSLAMDIAKDLQNDDTIKKLAEDNRDLFSKNVSIESLMQKMATDTSIQSLFSSVSSKIQKKIENKEIDPENLASQADTFLQSMNMNPILQTLKKNNTA